MSFIGEHRLQTILGSVLTLLGLLFWVMQGTFMKFFGFVTRDGNHTAHFIRQIGLLALAIPLLWAIYTIKKERDLSNRWTQKITLLSAIPTAWLMFYLLLKSLSYGRFYIW